MAASDDARIAILPAPGCRRSRKVMAWLAAQEVPFRAVPLDSPEGQRLKEAYDLRASPGILVDGVSVNPFDFLRPPHCEIDGQAAYRALGLRPEPPGER